MAAKIRTAFGNRIRDLRRARGFSQESLADEVGLHRTYIGAIERGEQNVSIDNIAKLAKALKVDIADLFKGM
jgi:transcriptional regulator with XRE-family HTH domain